MQIVIDIDENVYTRLFDNGIDVSTNDREHIETCIRKGIILPRWHGDLIDINELTTVTEIRPDGSEITYVPYSEIEEANVMVKADKENTDERNSD